MESLRFGRARVGVTGDTSGIGRVIAARLAHGGRSYPARSDRDQCAIILLLVVIYECYVDIRA
jgi:NAD(P)-dependent dehydrogenase (short-subunit alcohol dehydrogenase family)